MLKRRAKSELFSERERLHPAMKIRSHSESHLVELEDGSQWQIFPGDIDVTLGWTPETDLTLLRVDDEVHSNVLLSESGPVRVIAVGAVWPEPQVKSILKEG
ncbi:hypothetical protein [Bradyrhizobium genosp. P]|uniref:hypothetical protein n=1 Tax=Bradyrhizobium genosp. P TaxID=83641 RepID=UPI003CF3AEF5